MKSWDSHKQRVVGLFFACKKSVPAGHPDSRKRCLRQYSEEDRVQFVHRYAQHSEDLTPEEQQLVDLYRQADERGKRSILRLAQDEAREPIHVTYREPFAIASDLLRSKGEAVPQIGIQRAGSE